MDEASLLTLCMTAFAAVFTLLAILAGVMQMIMVVFPQAKRVIETAHVAAITSTYQALFPGARVTRIEEKK